MDFDCDDFEKTLKVIVVGNGNVGKTSMTTRYAKGKYTGNYKKTIGVDFMEKSVELRDLGETVNLMIWDTAGQEEFDALTSRYYKGAGAVIYVFSTVDRDSFDDLPKWKRKVEEECGSICQVLVQNKIDLVDDAAMSRGEVEDMADYMNIRLFRSCVQDNVNVKEVFEHLCRRFLKSSGNGGSDDTLNAVADITTLSELAGKSGGERGMHHSSSRDLHHSTERRGKREVSDISDAGSTPHETRSRSPHHCQQQRSRAPTGKPLPPSVPASIAKTRRYDDEDDHDAEEEYDDRDRRRRDDHEADEDRRRYKGERGSRRSDDRHRRERDKAARDDDKPKVATPSARSNSSSEFRENCQSHNNPPKSKKQQQTDRHDDDHDTSSSEERDPENEDAHSGRSTRAVDIAVDRQEEGGDDDDAEEGDRASSSSAAAPSSATVHGGSKLQPSKRRTNGKKRQSVPECVLS